MDGWIRTDGQLSDGDREMFRQWRSGLFCRLLREFWVNLHNRSQQDVEKSHVIALMSKIGDYGNQLGQR